jgi:cytochrome c oxidase subunit III
MSGPYGMALLNTLLLLNSGASLTWSHRAILVGGKKHSLISLHYTTLFAVLFMDIQLYEYKIATFSIADGIYGSCFYLLTGFHGFHVFVGTAAIIVGLIRTAYNHFTATQHVGLESAAWYWHFVDVVWVLVFMVIYWHN